MLQAEINGTNSGSGKERTQLQASSFCAAPSSPGLAFHDSNRLTHILAFGLSTGCFFLGVFGLQLVVTWEKCEM